MRALHSCDDDVEVASVVSKLHFEEVRQRKLKQDEARQIK